MARTRGAIDPSARNQTAVPLSPEQIASSDTEHAHQAAIFQWIALEGRKHVLSLGLLFAIPNGGDRRQSVGAALKAEGVKSGVPDLCWPVPTRNGFAVIQYPGLWIELKRPGLEGKVHGGRSDKQVQWHKDLLDQGYAVCTAYGWQAACWCLILYHRGELVMPDEDCFFAPATDVRPTFGE